MNTFPTQQFMWPTDHSSSTQIQQLKAAGISKSTPGANTQIKSPSTQGLPQTVSNITVTKSNVSASQVKLTISFTHNVGDPYFTGAQIYIKYGLAQPVFISGGSTSPITVTVARTAVSATVFVVSVGNWGSTPVSSSPAKAVSLA